MSTVGAWKFVNALHATQFWIGIRVIFGSVASYVFNPLWKIHRRTVYQFLDDHIDAALDREYSRAQERSPGTHSSLANQKPRSLLNVLLQQTKDKQEVRHQVLHALLALQNKTSTLLSNTIFLLSRSPDTWKQLRQEMTHLNVNQATPEDLRAVHLLQNIFNEGIK